jgi:hypothetical protein
MNYMQIAFCSKCDHSEEYGTERDFIGGVAKVVPKPEFCSQCGAKMLYSCPNCNVPRRSMIDKFCPKCGKAYK